jgi:thiamine biosynthesis lipoprotein
MMRCQPALGTYVEVSAHREGEATPALCASVSAAISAAFDAIAMVEACMSVFRPESDVSRLNAGAFLGQPGRIHPWLWDVLALAKEVHALSPAFDPCAGQALVRQGLRPAIVTTAQLYLDLGGIAKGAAVDHAVDALQAHGMTSGCVNAGGDLRVFGPHAQPIYVRHPSPPHVSVHAGDLAEGALATSGDYVVPHLIDPRRRQPLGTRQSFSVLAPRCAVADALTKVYALTGDAHHPALRHFGAHALETA